MRFSTQRKFFKPRFFSEYPGQGDYSGKITVTYPTELPMKLLIRNLPRMITAAELREMFEPYGHLQSCDVVMDEKTGKSKGFGFVEMPKAGDAKAAIQHLNGHRLEGSPIRVKKAEDRPTPLQANSQVEDIKPKLPAKPARKASDW